MVNRIIFWSSCLIIPVVPLAIGLTEEWALFVFKSAVFILFLVFLLAEFLHKKRGTKQTEFQDYRVPVSVKILFFVFLCTAVIQLLPLPHSLLKFLSPHVYGFYSDISSLGFIPLSDIGWKTLSLSPSLSAALWLQYISFGIFAYLIYKTINSKRDLKIVLILLLVSAIFQSIYGSIEFLTGNESILGYKKVVGLGSATGTFINRNHYAGFLEMIIPISLGYLLALSLKRKEKNKLSEKEKINTIGQSKTLPKLIIALSTAVTAIGLLFSRSRMGIFVFFVTMVIMLGLAFFTKWEEKKGRPKRRNFLLPVMSVLLLIVISVIVIGPDPIVKRFRREKLSQRRTVYLLNSTKIVHDYPLFGTGFGTFIHVYPKYDTSLVRGTVHHAHNDYMEALTEFGLVGGTCLILSVFILFMSLFLKWWKRRDIFIKGIGLGLIMGIFALLLHSLGDFNLHIPANAVYFAIVFVLGWKTVSFNNVNRL